MKTIESRNLRTATIKITRLELCNVLLALTCADGQQYKVLHDKLRGQLNELDKKIDGESK